MTFDPTQVMSSCVPLGWGACDQVWYKIGLIEPIFIGQAMSCKNIGRDAVESNILKLIVRPINIGRKSSNFIIIMFWIQYFPTLGSIQT